MGPSRPNTAAFPFALAAACLLAIAATAAGPARAAEIAVEGFTGKAIQQAIDRARPGDTVFLPAGTYRVESTIEVDKALTLRGEAALENVCEVEWSGPEKLPTWSGEPSKLVYADTYDFDMIQVPEDVAGVTFQRLFLLGGLESQRGGDFSVNGRLHGIVARGPDLTVRECQFNRHAQALGIYYAKAQNGLVENCFFQENFRAGSGYGVVMGYGATVRVNRCEFTRQRHDVVGNRPDSLLVTTNCYFHHNDPVVKEYSVDMHPEGGPSAMLIVRDCVFRDTAGVVYHAGAGEVTGNVFGPRVTDWYPEIGTILVGTNPTRSLDVAYSHDIYVGENVNRTGQRLVKLRSAQYPDGRRWSSWNVYEDGVLVSDRAGEHPPVRQSPEPLLGHIFVTEPGAREKVSTLTPGAWYDLHAMACDPQGARDIARIGIQIVDRSRHEYRPANEGGACDPAGNLFIESDGAAVRVRQTPGSDAWTGPQGGEAYVNPEEKNTWRPSGPHRIHWTVRFRLPEEANAQGDWRLYGYARDQAGHLPVENWLQEQIGWKIAVAPPDDR